MINLPQQPSPEAVEMLAKLMLLRAIRESPELFVKEADSNSTNAAVRIAAKLSKTIPR